MISHQFETREGLEIATPNYLDLEAMVAIQQQAYIDTYPGVNPGITTAVMRQYVSGQWAREAETYYRERLDLGSRLLAARVDEKLVGFCSVDNGGYIENFFIEAAYRRRHLGSILLLAHGVTGAFDCGARLDVVEGTPAEKIYQHIGFLPTSAKTSTEIAAGCYLYYRKMVINRGATAMAMARLRDRCEAVGMLVPICEV